MALEIAKGSCRMQSMGLKCVCPEGEEASLSAFSRTSSQWAGAWAPAPTPWPVPFQCACPYHCDFACLACDGAQQLPLQAGTPTFGHC